VSNGCTIEYIEIWHLRIPYKSTMRSSRGASTAGEKVVLSLNTTMGTRGLGEVSIIFPGRSGETAGTAFVALRDLFGPILLGRNPADISAIAEDLSAACSEQYAFLGTLCAIDLALHDLIARSAGMSVATFLGGSRRGVIKLSRSLSILPTPQLVESAQRYVEGGYPLLTLKGSQDWRSDIAAFLAVRDAVGGSVGLEIDPNQAWTPKATLEVDRALEGAGLSCIEQPCPWWDFEGMRHVTANASCAIAADESVLSPIDAMRVVKERAADIITLKLAKSGGLRHSRTIMDIARAGGLECNMGSKHTLGIGTAALLQFAAAFPESGETVGYGSPMERFVDDIIDEDIRIERGGAIVPEGPGFGVRLDPDRMARYTVESAELKA